jgi:hypothetical protein
MSGQGALTSQYSESTRLHSVLPRKNEPQQQTLVASCAPGSAAQTRPTVENSSANHKPRTAVGNKAPAVPPPHQPSALPISLSSPACTPAPKPSGRCQCEWSKRERAKREWAKWEWSTRERAKREWAKGEPRADAGVNALPIGHGAAAPPPRDALPPARPALSGARERMLARTAARAARRAATCTARRTCAGWKRAATPAH